MSLGGLWTAGGQHYNRLQGRRIWKTLKGALSFLGFDLERCHTPWGSLKSALSPTWAFPAETWADQTPRRVFGAQCLKFSL